MENIYYLLIAFLACWYFIYQRQIAEAARLHATKYCKKEHLQLISVARRQSRPKISKQDGLFMCSVFDFEFSSDGESHYQGNLTLKGVKLESIFLPPFKIN